MYGYPYPPMYPPPYPPQDNKEYIKDLKKRLKAATATDKDKKKEEKKIWWKRIEVGTTLFFLSPFIAVAYIGSFKLAWLILRTIFNN